jgi:O-antigen ligase
MIKIETSTLTWIASRFLIVVAGLNLNGLFLMLFNVNQVFSVPIMIASLYLIWQGGGRALSDSTNALLALAIITYLLFAYFYSATQGQEAPIQFAVTYISSILLIVAAASFASGRNSLQGIADDLRLLKTVLIISCLSAWFSPLFRTVFTVDLSDADRSAGFFGNPNETGMLAVVTVAIILSHPTRSKVLNLAQFIIAVGAIVLTFSKASLVTLILAVFVYGVRRARPLLTLGPVALAAFVALSTGLIVDFDLVELTSYQRERLENVASLLKGEITSETTTGRTDVWEIGWQRIEENILAGSGIGTFHNMVDGVRDEDDENWVGVHNTYLMVWGEAGLVAFLLLAIANAQLVYRALRSTFSEFALLYVVVLEIDMMAAHNVLGLRFHNLLTGMVIGTLMWQQESKSATLRGTSGRGGSEADMPARGLPASRPAKR